MFLQKFFSAKFFSAKYWTKEQEVAANQGGAFLLALHGTGGAIESDRVIPAEEILSGGFKEKEKHLPYKNHPWLSSPIRRYIEEVEPEIVEAVIEVVAKVTEKRTVQNKDVEAAQAEKALRERLASQHQAWKEMYAQLIRLEYERREQEYEDAQIAMLLFDL